MTITTAVTRKAHVHRVRMILVPDEALQGLSPPGPRDELTEEVERAGKNYVISTEPELMDDPHAIVVIGSKVASPHNGRLIDHDRDIRHSIIRLWTESDVIQWEADTPFVILSVKKVEGRRVLHSVPDSPDKPFYVDPPYASDASHVARSSIAKKAADNQQYKATIRIGGRTVDPDFVCGSPPPP